MVKQIITGSLIRIFLKDQAFGRLTNIFPIKMIILSIDLLANKENKLSQYDVRIV